jgi:hypothetical protein
MTRAELKGFVALFIIALLAATMPYTVKAQGTNFDAPTPAGKDIQIAPGWEGNIYLNAEKQWSHCGVWMTHVYKTDKLISLFVKAHSTGELSIGLFAEDWKVTHDKEYDLSWQFDKGARQAAVATGFGKSTLSMDYSARIAPTLIDMFAMSHQFHVYRGAVHIATFTLNGSGRSMHWLTRCISAGKDINRMLSPSARPIDPMPSPVPPQPTPAAPPKKSARQIDM